MTVYNHEDFVNESIQSVLLQTYKNFELIIINDGSTDGTWKILSLYEDYSNIIIKNIKHVGRSRALNFGFSLASGEYITIIDSDDLYLPQKLQKECDFLDTNKNIIMVGCAAIERDYVNKREYINRPPKDFFEIKRLLLYEAVFPFPSIMMHREVLKDVGFCDEKLELKEDFDLIGKFAAKGKIATIVEPLIIIKRHSKNNFRSYPSEIHRRCMLIVRWRNLWRLKPGFSLFMRMLMWHSFEFIVNSVPIDIRKLFPIALRNLFKKTTIIHPTEYFQSKNSIKYI